MIAVAAGLSWLTARIWFFVMIWRGSPWAAVLCLVVPLLWIMFVLDHWEEARGPICLWGAGLFSMLLLSTVPM